MATKRIKDITNTAASVASDAYLAIDGTSNGTEKITRDNFRQDTADAFVAAPGTYNLAPLSGGAVEVAKGGTGATTAAGARTNLEVNSIDEDAEATGTKLVGPALYFDGSNDYLEVSDSSKLTFSSSAEFGTNSSGTWSPDDNTPALTDGTGTTNQHYRVDSGAGTVTQGASTLSVINGTATTAGQAVYYDGSVWRLKDVDDLPFSISAWVKMTDTTSFTALAKYTGTAAEREWVFGTNGSDKLTLIVQDNAAGNSEAQESTTALTSYEGQWVHIAATYGGAGPNSASAFTAASDEMNLYVNGAAVAMTDVSGGTYTGMADAAGAVWIGRQSSTYSKGHIKDVKIFNRELTATEVAQLARGNDLGFSSEWGDHTTEMLTDGGMETWASATDLTNWSEGSAVSVAQEAVDIQGGTYSCELTGGGDLPSSSNYWLSQEAGIENGKRYRFSAKVKRVSGSTDTLQVGTSSYYTFITFNGSTFTATTNAVYMPESRIINQSNLGGGWYSVTVEFVPSTGSKLAFSVTGATDPYLIDDCSLVRVGTLADFRAENYDSSTGKIYDLSSNAFVGTSANLPTLTGRAYPVYETGSWTPTVTFGGGSTGITYTTQEGLYTRVGNTVWVSAYVLLSAKGSDTGTALINGLPFTASNTAASSQSFVVGNAANAANLTSAITAYATDNGTTINLVDWGATGSAVLDDTNFAATTALSISGTYQIQ